MIQQMLVLQCPEGGCLKGFCIGTDLSSFAGCVQGKWLVPLAPTAAFWCQHLPTSLWDLRARWPDPVPVMQQSHCLAWGSRIGKSSPNAKGPFQAAAGPSPTSWPRAAVLSSAGLWAHTRAAQPAPPPRAGVSHIEGKELGRSVCRRC